LANKPSALKRSTTARSSSSSVSASNLPGAPIPATRRADCGQLCEAARPIAKAIPTGLGDYATRTWSDDLSERTPQTAKVNNSTNGAAQQIGSGVLCGRGNQHYFPTAGVSTTPAASVRIYGIAGSVETICRSTALVSASSRSKSILLDSLITGKIASIQLTRICCRSQ